MLIVLQITEQIYVGSCIQTEKDVQTLSNVVVHTAIPFTLSSLWSFLVSYLHRYKT